MSIEEKPSYHEYDQQQQQHAGRHFGLLKKNFGKRPPIGSGEEPTYQKIQDFLARYIYPGLDFKLKPKSIRFDDKTSVSQAIRSLGNGLNDNYWINVQKYFDEKATMGDVLSSESLMGVFGLNTIHKNVGSLAE